MLMMNPSMLLLLVTLAHGRGSNESLLRCCRVDSETTTTFLWHYRANYHPPLFSHPPPFLFQSLVEVFNVSAGQGR